MAEIIAVLERVSFSPIPPGSMDRCSWEVTVERAQGFDGERWAVRQMGRCLNVLTEAWEHEPIPSSRTDQWLAMHRFDSYDQACGMAARLAPDVRWNGRTAAEIAARDGKQG